MISVLVPVYNVQGYLSKCVNSILSQTFNDYELILVDDGSKDDSGRICDDYASKDCRIKVYHQSNQGIGATREFALQRASGDYVMWVDSDDWIESDMMSLMVQSAESNHSDIVSCCFDVINPDAVWKNESMCVSKDSYLRNMIASQWAVLWRHLFRRSLIVENTIHFPVGINNGEDYYFVIKSLLCANKITFVDKILYHYTRLNNGSTIATPNLNKTFEQIASTKLVEQILKENGLLTKYKKELLFRKHIAKEPLLKVNFWKWLTIFPEASIVQLRAWAGALKNHR